ncbi:MAG: hypothetical protein AAFQ65_02000 [Myxococcota bacterium]
MSVVVVGGLPFGIPKPLLRAATLFSLGVILACSSDPRTPAPPVSDPAVFVCEAGADFDHDGEITTPCRPVSPPCSPGQLETRAPTVDWDRQCSDCRAGQYCDGHSFFERCSDGTFDHDSDAGTPCEPASECPVGTYIDGPSFEDRDQTCEPCVAGQVCTRVNQTRPPPSCEGSFDHDLDPSTACEPLRTCDVGSYIAEQSTSTSDRGCAPCPALLSSAQENSAHCDRVTTPVAVSSLATAGRHICAIWESNGETECWGDNARGQAHAPDLEMTRLWAGWRASCGARADNGQLICWGYDESGLVSNVPNVVPSDVAIGPTTACLIEADTQYVQCWGEDDHGQASPEPRLTLLDIDVGSDYACGIRSDDGSIVCWGNVPFDSVPTGVFDEVALPSHPWEQACALSRSDGFPVCWGDEQSTVVEDPARVHSLQIVNLGTVCGISDEQGGLLCWPSPFPHSPFRYEQFPGVAVESFEASSAATCIIEKGTGRPHCGDPPSLERAWLPGHSLRDGGHLAITGSDNNMCLQFADESWHCYRGAYGPPSNVAFRYVSSARYHGCGIEAETGYVRCWGDREEHIAVPTDKRFVKVATSANGTCVVDESQTVSCFGPLYEDTPAVPMTHIAMGNFAACGVADDRIRCWGSDEDIVGKAPMGSFVDVFVGHRMACAIRQADRTAVCWGSEPHEPPAGVPFSTIAPRIPRSCGLRVDNREIECWGRPVLEFVFDNPLGPFLGMTALHNPAWCALRSGTGELVCWGDIKFGE